MIAGHVNTKLPPIAGVGQSAMTNMKLDIEMLVIDPVRVVQFKGHVNEPASENR